MQLRGLYIDIIEGKTINIVGVKEQLKKLHYKLYSLRNSGEHGLDKAGFVLRNIAKLTRSLSALIKEKSKLNNMEQNLFERKRVNSDMMHNLRNKSVVIKLMTQDMMVTKNQNFTKGHRLPKAYVKVLEKWYQDNLSNPYLDDEGLMYIMQKCSLNKTQIKNWVANRRRKAKKLKISPDISRLLN